MIGAIFGLAACGIYVIRLKCPTCNKPVLYNPVNYLGISMYTYTPGIPKRCSKCGAMLE